MLIEVKDLTKRYGEGPLAVMALADIELLIDQGEFVVVSARPGAARPHCSMSWARSTPQATASYV